MSLQDVFRWFTGGERQYRTLDHCMAEDWAWIALTVGLDLAVAAGYLVIAGHWWQNQRRLSQGDPARMALGRMRNIFLFCGLCGYLFIPIKMVWPAWRLYDLFMIVLVYSTWRYALDARNLRVVYDQLRRTDALAEELAAERAESRRRAEFLNAVSHDLKTPMNGFSLQLSSAEALLDQGDIETARQAIEIARGEAMAAAALLEVFLELGELDIPADPVPFEPFALDPLLAALAEWTRSMAESRGLAIRLDVKARGLWLKADRSKLERALKALLQNAVRFTHEGELALSVRRDGSGLTIDVEDTGVGIAPEDLPRVFEEFYQVDNRERDRANGYGLGLPLARRLVVHLGGELLATSLPGQGSRFRIRLPGSIVLGRASEAQSGIEARGLGVASISPPGPDR